MAVSWVQWQRWFWSTSNVLYKKTKSKKKRQQQKNKKQKQKHNNNKKKKKKKKKKKENSRCEMEIWFTIPRKSSYHWHFHQHFMKFWTVFSGESKKNIVNLLSAEDKNNNATRAHHWLLEKSIISKRGYYMANKEFIIRNVRKRIVCHVTEDSK